MFTTAECEALTRQVDAAIAACNDESAALRRANGATYGARNLLALFPPVLALWKRPELVELLTDVLGPHCGLVRGLFFDKPPRGSWSLPWHRDLTIAVQQHRALGGAFRRPTTKAGVPHVEAPDDLLRQMLTMRIHLDAATSENGPLQVVPGSHHSRDSNPIIDAVAILADVGDVLAMRPLLLHSSGESLPDTNLHRRVIHLEFAARQDLAEGYCWRTFIPLTAQDYAAND